MLEFIALLATGAATVVGYVQSRRFVRRRLAYVDALHRTGAPLVAGAMAALVATPVTWLLPLVGGGTALLFGAAVAAGVAAGRREVRRALRA